MHFDLRMATFGNQLMTVVGWPIGVIENPSQTGTLKFTVQRVFHEYDNMLNYQFETR